MVWRHCAVVSGACVWLDGVCLEALGYISTPLARLARGALVLAARSPVIAHTHAGHEFDAGQKPAVPFTSLTRALDNACRLMYFKGQMDKSLSRVRARGCRVCRVQLA
jgi:hypothetical protein